MFPFVDIFRDITIGHFPDHLRQNVEARSILSHAHPHDPSRLAEENGLFLLKKTCLGQLFGNIRLLNYLSREADVTNADYANMIATHGGPDLWNCRRGPYGDSFDALTKANGRYSALFRSKLSYPHLHKPIPPVGDIVDVLVFNHAPIGTI